ncbi:MAG: cysteine synthase family protein [Planctomycetota bacterium]|nr:cysteine synthase family protein [Planctomycetota bacterium]
MDKPTQLEALGSLIGGTPMLAIQCKLDGQAYTVFAKAEHLNFTGSIKDRMALHILREAYEKGAIGEDDVIAEATSGNTGIAFAAIGRALGHEVRIYMPDWMSRERVLVIESLGAKVVPVSKDEGGFVGSIELVRQRAADEPGTFLPSQFDNQANVEAHRRATGPEILAQLGAIGRVPTAFVAGVGTGGTVMGVARFLRRAIPSIKVHPLEPAESPTLRTGSKVGSHRIQGISDEFIPSIVDLDFLDGVVDASDGDGILMAQALASRLGLAVGISSGANLLGALQVAREQGPDSIVVTVFPDCNKKYLSTDLFSVEPALDSYLTPRVEFVGFEVLTGTRVAPAPVG